MSNLEQIHHKLSEYKKRYYKRQILVGSLFFFILSISLFLFFAFLEHHFWMSTSARSIIFYLFLIVLLGSLIVLIIRPLSKYLNIDKGINNETAASEISKYFPEIEDRLINLLELGKQKTSDNELINAAIDKKANSFKEVKFTQAVDFSVAKKYVIGFGVVIICFFLVSFINPEIVKDSPKRIANYSIEYEKESPFQFILLNTDLNAFKGEDFIVSFEVKGEALPEKVFLKTDKISKNPIKSEDGTYSYTFERIQNDRSFVIEANGFQSKNFNISTVERPDLLSMIINVVNPLYTGGEKRTITNSGDLTVLEGSNIIWNIEALATEEAKHIYNEDTSTISRQSLNQFVVEKRVAESGTYQISLKNEHSTNKSELIYDINVIKDLHPKINAEFFPDSASYQFITLAGSIADDYGFSKLTMNYRKGEEESFRKIPLEINLNSTSQSFYANWDIDSLNLGSGSKLEIYVAVSDNDQVNGAKTSKSGTFVFQIPSENEIDNILSEKSEGVKDQLDEAKKNAEEISERLSELEDRLKTEQKFDWQEKKMVEDIIEDREKLNQELNELQKKHQELQKSTNQFKKQSSQLKEKNEKLQELMKELMDEETRKLYEKLKELMKENAPKDQISEQLKELQRNEQNLERDMERALELFKRLKMESVLEENLQKLDTLSSKQEDASKKDELDESEELQKDVDEQFENFRKKMDEVMEMNQDLKRPEALEDFEYEERQIAKELREIQEMMDQMKESEKGSEEGNENQEQSGEQNPGDENQEQGEENEEQEDSNKQPSQNKQKKNNLKQKQQDAAQKMKNLSQKLSSMQGGMQMEMMQANLDQLRDILDNLIKLSFNQEEIMDEMRQVNQSDPRFLELSQNQLKLKDDAKVIQDSLLSLASRVVQISSFVTREVDQINESVNETIDYLKDRNRGRALTSQQFALTSINNLALLLDDTMEQMQMAMSEAMGSGSDQKQKQQGIPDMQELQNQLGEKINDLKGSGKEGRELSEELARLAAEQEMIRQQMEMLKQAEEGRPGGGQAGDQLQKAIDMMERNEIDLVNKRLTEQLIFRQKQIQTRLLEADKAKREQETEEEREAESPSIISREIPPEFEEYLKQKKKEIELLKTIPLELNPFYKKEVNDYFRRISSEESE